MNKKLVMSAVVMAGAMASAPAAAVTNFSSNFDGVTFANGIQTVASIDGWTATGPLGIQVHTGGVGGASKSGANYVELDTTANSAMSRAIDAGLYTLTFSYSAQPGTTAATNGIGLYLGNTLIRGVSASGLDRFGNAKANTSWLTFTSTFTAQQGETLSFRALGTSDGLGGYLDSVSLVGTALPIPEPGEWAMMAAGLGVVGFAASRRKRRA
jgi:hypothetical protein